MIIIGNIIKKIYLPSVLTRDSTRKYYVLIITTINILIVSSIHFYRNRDFWTDCGQQYFK